MTDTPIPDGDYILTEGCGWFQTNNFAIRIFSGESHVVVQVYDDAAMRRGENPEPIQELVAYEFAEG